MRKHFFISFLLFAASCSVFAQLNVPQDYFRSPLDIPLLLSGNFGELRSNHFHSGIDIKTQGVEGKKVYAIADGYVSRIKVSATGYGNALYIVHPNGYTSVYGHLKSYNSEIAKYVKKAQYEQESFEVELFPTADALPVSKGDVIALSGNSGGSGGPHLHFEIRDTKTEHPLNVLEFGFDVKDDLPPTIENIVVYPLEKYTHVNHTNQKVFVKPSKNPADIKYAECSGLVGIGIETYDKLNGAANHNGVYSVELIANGKRIYYSKIDQFAFDETRYINAHIDYASKVERNKSVQKCFLTSHNRLPFYSGIIDYGVMPVAPDSIIKLEIIVKDVYGNTEKVPFELRGKKPNYNITPDTSGVVKKMPHHKSNFFVNDEIEVRFPEYAFYDDLDFKFKKLPARQGTVCPVYALQDLSVPVHKYYSLSIVLNDIPEGKEEKLLIVSYDKRGEPVAEGGTLRGNKITTKTRSFGEYTVMLDETPPKINPFNISEGKDVSSQGSITVMIGDDLSGIASYKGTINGKWVLMEYDAKNNKLTHTFDENTPKGELNFELVVSDERGNTSTYKAKLVR